MRYGSVGVLCGALVLTAAPVAAEVSSEPDRPDRPRSEFVVPPVGPTTTPLVDPGEPGPHPVTRIDYRSSPLPWPAYPAPMEVIGHAVLPEDVDGAPLVLFLHGRHDSCYGDGDPDKEWPCRGKNRPVPSHLGYDYLQRILASQGYATVSIAANAINGQDVRSLDAGASARSQLVRHHLKLLDAWTSTAERSRWYGRVDLEQVVLVGHSRGGEGVNQVAIDTTADAPYSVAGQVLIGPSAVAYQTAGYTPTVVVLPYCDGDLAGLPGQRFVDAAGTLTTDDPTLRSSVLLSGANHNFFNTEWTPGLSQAPSEDDGSHSGCSFANPSFRLSAAEQRRAARSFVGAAVHAFVEGDASALDLLDAGRLPVELPAAGGAIAWTHALGGNRDTVRVGVGARVTGAAQVCLSGSLPDPPWTALPMCGGRDRNGRLVHWTPATLGGEPPDATGAYRRYGLTRQLRFAWSQPGRVGGLRLHEPFDLSGEGTTLDLRVVSDPARHPTRFAVRLADGDSSWTSPDQLVRRLPGHMLVVPMWARTVRVGLSDVPADLDLTDIRSIEFVSRSDGGRIWLLDASARRPGLAPSPQKRLPSIRIGRGTVSEADGGGIGEVPFHVDGEVATTSRFAVVMGQQSFASQTPPRYDIVTVSPGQTGGKIEVPYGSDALDDRGGTNQLLHAVPLDGLAMSDHVGRLVVTDDDPTPRLRVAVGRHRVAYGQRMVFVARLARPVDYGVTVWLRGVMLDRFRPLRVADVPERWATTSLPGAPKRVAVARWIRGWPIWIRAGSTSARYRVPTRAHPPHPSPKALTIRFSSGLLGDPVRRTVRVR
jgi:hypothetical protein